MSNERLRSAITQAGHDYQSFSQVIGVDPKTVERWVSKDRLPHRTHRLKSAAALGQDDAYLWPTTYADKTAQSASRAELVEFYPNRGSVPLSVWTSLIDGARESIDILAFAGSFLHDGIPDFDQRLIERARSGVAIRLLFGDPTSQAVQLRGQEEGIDDLLAARCRLTWNYCRPLLDEPGIDGRQHGSTLYTSIFRFDESVLANTHLLGAPASHAPVLHLQRIDGGRVFTQMLRAFDDTWNNAQSVN